VELLHRPLLPQKVKRKHQQRKKLREEWEHGIAGLMLENSTD
jgi:hypothetical protein